MSDVRNGAAVKVCVDNCTAFKLVLDVTKECVEWDHSSILTVSTETGFEANYVVTDCATSIISPTWIPGHETYLGADICVANCNSVGGGLHLESNGKNYCTGSMCPASHPL